MTEPSEENLKRATTIIDLPGKLNYRAVSANELLAMDFPPRENILSPWLPSQGVVMAYGTRGVGKTQFSIGVAHAAASGGTFLRWPAQKPVGVLFIDGEMPAVVLQERLANVIASSECEITAPLEFVTPDLQDRVSINLADLRCQDAIEPLLDDKQLIIVDNISTLCHGGKENEAEGWLPMQGWALRQRSKGRSVLFIHHAGKGGHQRGTSRREDVLDTIIKLKHPGDYDPSQGARFVVEFEKNRGFHGDDAKAFEATLINGPDGLQTWATKDIEESTFDQVVAMLGDGVPQSDVARELDVNRSTVSRHARKAREQGLIP